MFFGADGVPMPEELQQALEAHMERAEMSAEAGRHDILRFFDEQSIENLLLIRSLLHHCAGDESGRYPSHLEGFISGVLQYKHGVCTGCGKNHDDLSALVPDADKPADDDTEQLELFGEAGPTIARELHDYEAKMNEYNLRLPREGEVDARSDERPVICVDCGALYQSLEDRMLRPAGIDGCYGCQHKSAHG